MTDLTIESIGARGDGLASGDGGPVYVPYTVPGDRVRVRLGGKRGEGRAADLLEVLSPGPGRTKPVCRHFSRCGGCALQHVADEPYADWNREQVTTALHRRGFIDVDVRPVVRTPPGSRRRADLALLLRRDGRAVVGYHERASHHIIDVTECPVLDPGSGRAVGTAAYFVGRSAPARQTGIGCRDGHQCRGGSSARSRPRARSCRTGSAGRLCGGNRLGAPVRPRFRRRFHRSRRPPPPGDPPLRRRRRRTAAGRFSAGEPGGRGRVERRRD